MFDQFLAMTIAVGIIEATVAITVLWGVLYGVFFCFTEYPKATTIAVVAGIIIFALALLPSDTAIQIVVWTSLIGLLVWSSN